MSRLKNITPGTVTLQMFHISTPYVNFAPANITLSLKPGEDVDEAAWQVANINDPSYNCDIIDDFIAQGIISRLLV